MESTNINMQVVVRSKVNDFDANRDSKVHWPNMGPIWVRHDPGGPQVVPWNLLSGNAIRSHWTKCVSVCFHRIPHHKAQLLNIIYET